MCRDLSLPTRAVILPEGITIRRWGIKNNEAKLRYLAASESAFPQALQTIEDIDFYMRSWQGGTLIIAFNFEGEIVGGLMAFWYDKRNGVTEDIFVLPPWRRQGIASCLVVEGIKFLAQQQVEQARNPGIKGVRARLSVDAGVDTIEKPSQ
ncbi:MAG TPA: GNAT family N-acetyltransferase [Anaerolineales bacterium]|nr:GNAT family N-acetyltransferase [Anaerolineales bacterium]